jgi:hypothetical protein
MKDNYKNYKKINPDNVTETKKPESSKRSYSFYSKVLQKPFDTVAELVEAENVYYSELKAKENKAATKKADALKVEEAFKAMNQARRDYKDNILKLTDLYQQDLKALKDNFENEKNRIKSALADAENIYSAALKNFTDKYPEGYHLTLKDGDYETSISSTSSEKTTDNSQDTLENLKEFFNIIFGF